MLTKKIESDLIQEYSKIVIREVAPDELPLFDEVFASQKRTLSGDHMLGSGLDQITELVSPAIIAAVSSVLTYTLREIIRNLEKKDKESIKQEIGNLFEEKKDHGSSLSVEQLRVIKATVQKQLQDFGWDEVKARRAANAIIGALSVKNVSKKS